jgi:hypothetical protein
MMKLLIMIFSPSCSCIPYRSRGNGELMTIGVSNEMIGKGMREKGREGDKCTNGLNRRRNGVRELS